MSFARSFEESRKIQGAIQNDKKDGRDGDASSPILKGSDSPGTSMEHPVPEMTLRRTKLHARTTKLTRKYAAS